MSNLPPLDIKDGVALLHTLVGLHDAVLQLAGRLPDAEASAFLQRLEQANDGIKRLLESIDQKSRR